MPALATIGEGLVELTLDSDHDYLRLAPGGDAANIAVMAAALGATTRIGGRVGADPLGSWLRAFWRGRGVDVTHVDVDPDATTGLYLNTPGGARFTYWRAASAGSRLAPAQLEEGFFADVGILVVTGVTVAVSGSSAAAAWQAIDQARRRGARIACVLNHRPALGADPAQLAALAAAADIMIGSVEDAAAVFGETDPARLAHAPLTADEVVLTAGPQPVVAAAAGTLARQPVPAAPAVDAAGAGDAFAGAYLAQRLAGRPVAEALAWGVAASARSVTQRGCARSYPTAAETAELVEELLTAA